MDLLRAGEPARKKLDAIQAQITETKRAARDVERAPLATEDARVKVRAALERAQRSGEWATNALLRFGRVADRYELPDATGGVPWAVLIALLGPKEAEDRLVALCTAAPGARGLPAGKRAAKLDELRAKLDDLERREEQEVLALEAAGHVVLRRADVRPELLLELWQAMSPPTAAPTPRDPADAPVDLGAINQGRHLNRKEAERSTG